MIEKLVKAAVALVLVAFMVAGFGLALAFPIKWTWNAVMPYLFALPTITWGKAWCLLFLSGMLVKGTNTTSK